MLGSSHSHRVSGRLCRWRGMGVAALVALGAACGGGGSDKETGLPDAPPADGTVAGCRGSYEGTFEGDASGTMTGSFDGAGNLQLSMATTETGYTGAGSTVVQGSAEFVLAVGAYQVRGTFDLTTCAASGTWAQGRDRGTWTLTRVSG
jgi:hypothetical protein